MGSFFSKKRVALLNALRHASSRQRLALLKTADRDLIRCICECVLNVLRGVRTLDNSQAKRLRKYENILRELIREPNAKVASTWTSKNRKIVQSGGAFLPTPLSRVLSTSIFRVWTRKTLSKGNKRGEIPMGQLEMAKFIGSSATPVNLGGNLEILENSKRPTDPLRKAPKQAPPRKEPMAPLNPKLRVVEPSVPSPSLTRNGLVEKWLRYRI
ncbi:hypothetical protein QAD02_021694 [Eretmocerus hayati]|uniref:Uncharacterized protein n=1 Tax=Eretmocerus hayati TaxID=131215 RepID=A0ACC2PSV4_9HYME|nr:hypothetical protein QAD02_021694 [Eretmocerus hayati]